LRRQICKYSLHEWEAVCRYNLSDDDGSSHEEPASGTTSFFISNELHPRLRRSSAIDEDNTSRRRCQRAPPCINVNREIEQTLARPAATRDSAESDPNDKAMAAVPAPASETMC
jgi:hypothetical protein